MSKEKDFDETVALLGDHVIPNVTKVVPKDLAVPLLFRIDESLPKKFIPRMPKSAAPTEDSTVPRVVTADTLFGCMTGHAAMVWCVLDRDAGYIPNNYYKITSFAFDFALRPNKKLVYDAEDSLEHWLITYDQSTKEYDFNLYGEFFIHKVSVVVRGDAKVNDVVAEILVKVDGEKGLPFCKDLILPKGCHYIKANVSRYALGSGKDIPKRMSVADKSAFDVMPINEKMYKSFKELSVSRK